MNVEPSPKILEKLFLKRQPENVALSNWQWQTISKQISVRTKCIFHDILNAFCNIISGIINLSTAIFKDKFFFKNTSSDCPVHK